MKKLKKSMKQKICILTLFFFGTFAMYAQSSLSINYMYIGSKEKYGVGISKDLSNHGIDVQSKIHLKNRFYLMPDVGYFFSDYEKITYSGSYRENTVRYYAVNANLAYTVSVAGSFSVLPFAGIGYFHEYASMRSVTGGDPSDPSYPPQFPSSDVTEKENAGSIVCNIGFNVELYLYKNIFFTAGLKYMLDVYDTKYNGFPYINAGIGYSF